MQDRGSRRVLPAAACLLFGLGLAAPARSETLACRRVPRVPFTIALPGVYCLARSLATASPTGTAITIAASDVVLDLNGRTLDGSPAGSATQAIGIGASGRSNVTVKNGTVRGFQTGIQLTSVPGTHGNVVETIRADRNTVVGVSAGGLGVVIRDNLVVETGGSTAPAPIGGLRSTGISAFLAPGGVVSGNQVVNTATPDPGSFDYGIHAANSNGILIQANSVQNPTPSPAFSFGIIVPFSQNAQIVDNRVSDVEVGISYSSSATGKYRDNLTDGVATPFDGTGTDAGGNN